MYSGTRRFIVSACTAVVCLGPAAPFIDAQTLLGVIESYYPTQAPVGQTTVLNVAMGGGRANPITSIEITPSTGITIGAMKASEPSEGVVWFEIPITVAKDAPAVPQTVDFQFAAADTGGSIGDKPHVYFTVGCGNTEPTAGMVNGKVTGNVVRASIPNPHTHPKVGAPPPGNRCDLEVRASDATMVDSNTLKTTVEFK